MKCNFVIGHCFNVTVIYMCVSDKSCLMCEMNVFGSCRYSARIECLCNLYLLMLLKPVTAPKTTVRLVYSFSINATIVFTYLQCAHNLIKCW